MPALLPGGYGMAVAFDSVTRGLEYSGMMGKNNRGPLEKEKGGERRKESGAVEQGRREEETGAHRPNPSKISF